VTAWSLLVAAGLLEIVWAVLLKQTEGFTRAGPSALAVATAALSFYLLSRAMAALPTSTAYAVWVGIGIGGVALFGMLALNEPAGLLRLACIGLIVAGVLGLQVT